MCGIYCYVGVEDFNVSEIISSLHHRGPDSQAVWQRAVGTKKIDLIHTRLAILDLSDAGHQPMVDTQTGNVIVFNGEIYNFLELRQELKAQGVEFSSRSDTEVLLLGYRIWGEHLLKKLDGMFAFIIFDSIKQTLLIARDHVGIKPLYYAQTHEGGIVFCSEVRTLISSGLVAKEWDEESIYDYMVYGSIQEPRTIRKAIKAFPPAHYAYLDLQQDSNILPIPHRYWNLADFATNRNLGVDSQNIHNDILQSTLQEQVIADVPVGLFLSAGIDSTVLASLLAPIMDSQLLTFTFSLQDSNRDESELAATTAQVLNLKHNKTLLSDETLNTWLLDSFSAMDQPSSDGSNTYIVSRAAAEKGITVAISGCGADELHGGYPHFNSLSQLYSLGQLSGIFKPMVIPILEKAMGWRKNYFYQERLNILLQQIEHPSQMLQEVRRFFTPSQISAFLPNRYLDIQSQILSNNKEITDNTDIDIETLISLKEIEGYLLNTLLRDSDWATMANQQELRVPYLGKRYMETVMQIPWKNKRSTSKSKKPLLSCNIPSHLREIQRRKKTGFELDYATYLIGSLRDSMYAAFTHLNDYHGFHLDPNQAEQDFKMGDRNKQARRYWALTSLGLYLQKHN